MINFKHVQARFKSKRYIRYIYKYIYLKFLFCFFRSALEPKFRNGPQLNYYVYLMSEGDCLINPSGFTSPVVQLVPHNDIVTYLNVTARQWCSFNFSVQAENIHGPTQQTPKRIMVTAVLSVISWKGFMLKVFFFKK